MSLRAFLLLFWKERIFFFGTIFSFVVMGLLIQLFQPIQYVAEITMNVARSDTQTTSDYTYDDFYRLQADERFADTVVRWLESPRIIADIERKSKVPEVSLSFDADRLSSQIIRIRYTVTKEKSAFPVAKALLSVLNAETESLNQNRQKDGWFALVGTTPFVQDARFGKMKAIAVSFSLGMFFGFFVVLFRYAMRIEKFDRK